MPPSPLRRSFLLVVTIASLGSVPLEARAQAAPCVDLCGMPCVKPWSFADRWDDVTGIAGYMGEPRTRGVNPDWRNNGVWDHEAFVDTNGNGLYDDGEPYVDGNLNQSFDAEAYDPALTGYTASAVPGNVLAPAGDLGLELVLRPGSTTTVVLPVQYMSFALPPLNDGVPVTGEEAYRENMSGCNPAIVDPGDWLRLETGALAGATSQVMRELVALDPDAYWEPSTGTVQGSLFELSPRVVFLPVHDPRIPVLPGQPGALRVVKIVAFFMETLVGPAEVRGRLLRTETPGLPAGTTCGAGQVGGFIVDCPVPAERASWGRVKASYR